MLRRVASFAYKLDPETGSENIVLFKDLDWDSSEVVCSAREIRSHQNYQRYFDNYFTSEHLLEYLGIDVLNVIEGQQSC